MARFLLNINKHGGFVWVSAGKLTTWLQTFWCKNAAPAGRRRRTQSAGQRGSCFTEERINAPMARGDRSIHIHKSLSQLPSEDSPSSSAPDTPSAAHSHSAAKLISIRKSLNISPRSLSSCPTTPDLLIKNNSWAFGFLFLSWSRTVKLFVDQIQLWATGTIWLVLV